MIIVSAPLNLLTRKDTPFIWGEQQRESSAFLITDACDVAIGAVLHQIQEGAEGVLGYYSKSLNSAQRKNQERAVGHSGYAQSLGCVPKLRF